jgi:hypothetical protein
MPVRRIIGLPNTMVYTRAGVVVHQGHVFHAPIDIAFVHGGESEVLEFARASIQNIDWSARVEAAVMGPYFILSTPMAMIFFGIYLGHDMIL